MRWRAAAALGVAALLGVVVVAVEMAARPVAERVASDAVEQCGGAERVEVVALARPAVLDVMRGRLRDVVVELGGVTVGELRLDEVRLEVPRVDGLFSAAAIRGPLAATAVVTESDVEHWLAARAPGFVRPTLRITDGQVIVSDERVPFDLRLAVELHGDAIRVTPGAGDRRLWSVLDIGLELPLIEAFDARELTLDDGRARVTGTLEPLVDPDRRMVCR